MILSRSIEGMVPREAGENEPVLVNNREGVL